MTSTRAAEEWNRKVSCGGTKPVTKDYCRQFDFEACNFNELHLTTVAMIDAKLAKGMRKTAFRFATVTIKNISQ